MQNHQSASIDLGSEMVIKYRETKEYKTVLPLSSIDSSTQSASIIVLQDSKKTRFNI